MQTIISGGLQDILTALVGVFAAFLVAYIKQHLSAIQISTATGIAIEAVNFSAQAAKRLGITQGFYTQDNIVNMIKVEMEKVVSNLPMDEIAK